METPMALRGLCEVIIGTFTDRREREEELRLEKNALCCGQCGGACPALLG